MEIEIRKIHHRGADRIAIFFPVNDELRSRLSVLNIRYSRTHRCWYCDYAKDTYKKLLKCLEGHTVVVVRERGDRVFVQTEKAGVRRREDLSIAQESDRQESPVHKRSKTVAQRLGYIHFVGSVTNIGLDIKMPFTPIGVRFAKSLSSFFLKLLKITGP